MEIFQLNFKNINVLIPELGSFNEIPINETRIDYLFKASVIPLAMSLSTLLFYKPPSTFAWFVCLLFGVMLTVIGTVIQAELSTVKDSPALAYAKYVSPVGGAIVGLMLIIFFVRYARRHLQRKKDKKRKDEDPNYKPQQKMEDIDNFEAISKDVAFLKKSKLKMARMLFIGVVALVGFILNLTRITNRNSDAFDNSCFYTESRYSIMMKRYDYLYYIEKYKYDSSKTSSLVNYQQPFAQSCMKWNINVHANGYGNDLSGSSGVNMIYNNYTGTYEYVNNTIGGSNYNNNKNNDIMITESATFNVQNNDNSPYAQFTKCCYNAHSDTYDLSFVLTCICGPLAFLSLINFFGSLSVKGRKTFTKLNSFIRKSSLKVVLIVLGLTYMPITTVLFKFLICSPTKCAANQQVNRFGVIGNNIAGFTPRINDTFPITPTDVAEFCVNTVYDDQCPVGFPMDNSDSLLTIDPTLSCKTEIHPYFLPGGLLLLMVFSFGVPFLYYRLVKLVNEFLLKIRVMETATNEWLVKIKASKNSCSQMYNSFESKWKYFKLALIMYRLLIVSCFVFLVTLDKRNIAVILICCIHCSAMLFAIYSRSYYNKSNQFVVYAVVGMNIIACVLVISSTGGNQVSETLVYPTSILNFLVPIIAFSVGYIVDKRQAKKLLITEKSKVKDENVLVVQKTTEMVIQGIKEEPALEKEKPVSVVGAMEIEVEHDKEVDQDPSLEHKRRKSIISRTERTPSISIATMDPQARKTMIEDDTLQEGTSKRKASISKAEEVDNNKNDIQENIKSATQNRKGSISKTQARNTKNRASELNPIEPHEETAEDLKKVKKRLHQVVKEDREKIQLMDMVLDRKILKLVLNYFVVLAVSSAFALAFGVIAIYTQKSFIKVFPDTRGYGAIKSTEFGNFASWSEFSNNCCCITSQSDKTVGFEVWKCRNNNVFQYKVVLFVI